MGIEVLTAHLFIFYFATLADITPPVGVTAFSAAGLANAPPMKTALFSVKYAFAGFVVPYFFVYHPAIILQSSNLLLISFSTISAVVSVIIIASSLMGVMFAKLTPLERIIMGGLGIVSISPIFYISLICLFLMLGRSEEHTS